MTKTAVQERSGGIEATNLFSSPPVHVLKSPANTVAIFVYSIAHAQEILTQFWSELSVHETGNGVRMRSSDPLHRFENAALNLRTSWESTHSKDGVEVAKFGDTRGVYVTFETLDGGRFPPEAMRFFSSAGYLRQKKLPLSL